MIFYEAGHRLLTIFDISDNFSFCSHIHKQLELMLCTKGEMVITCERKEYTLHEHSWLIVLPETEHSYVSSDNANGSITIVSPSLIPGLNSYFVKRIVSPVIHNADPMAEDCMNKLRSVYDQQKNSIVEKGFLYVILGLLFDQCEFEPYPTNHHADLCYNVLKYISENFRSDITLESIAARFGINPGYLSRTFKLKIGCGMIDILNGCRIDYAKYLLTNTDLPMTEICYESGFTSLRNFNRWFVKAENCTPSDFRNSHNKR